MSYQNRQRMLDGGIIRALNSRDMGGKQYIETVFGGTLRFITAHYRPRYGKQRLMQITLPDGTELQTEGAHITTVGTRKLDKLAAWFILGVAACGNIVGWAEEMRREYIDAMEADDADEDDILSFCAHFPIIAPPMVARDFQRIRTRLGLDIQGLAARMGEADITVRSWDGGFSPIPGSAARLMEAWRDQIAA